MFTFSNVRSGFVGWRPAAALTSSVLLGLCAVHCGGLPAGGGSGEGEGSVQLALAEIPADVACIRVNAAGAERTLVRNLGVEPGKTFTTTLAGVPLGAVVFSAGAFAAACDDVTASATPAWVSEEDTVAVVLGRQATVSLTLHRNGRAKVSLDFADEAACTATGAACLASAQCCSRSCVRGTCQAAGTGGAGGGGSGSAAGGAGGADGDSGGGGAPASDDAAPSATPPGS